jgi:Tfp pilus assembly protein PilN
MRTQINLSRQPFTNRRVLWIVLVAVYLTSFWLFLWIATEKDRVLAKETELKLRIDGQRQAAIDAKLEQDRRNRSVQKIVATDQQALQLAAARQLIQCKGFSWNRLIGEIEGYVPKHTRIMSIKVEEISNEADQVLATVQVKALGTTSGEMTEMMAALEKSGGLFTVGEAGQDATLETGETPFTLNLIYKPSRGASQ